MSIEKQLGEQEIVPQVFTGNNSRPHFTIIGDVHGKYEQYKRICAGTDYSLQLGDMGFNYDPITSLDANKHRFFGGNHDGYHLTPVDLDENDPQVIDPKNHYVVTDRVYNMHRFPKHSLGQWGTWEIPEVNSPNLSKIFFVRGAWSIDQKWRTEGIDWFKEEELNQRQARAAFEDYKRCKPDFVVTHCVPTEFLPSLRLLYSDGKPIPTQTGSLLQAMFDYHKPKLWVFGHYHQDLIKEYFGTFFICLSELSVLEFDKNMNILGTSLLSIHDLHHYLGDVNDSLKNGDVND